MRNELTRVFPELIALFLRVLLVLAIVVRDLDEPNSGSDEDIHVLYMWLHSRYGLNGRSARSNDRHAIVLPLLTLIVLRPCCGVDDATLEAVDTFDTRPLVVVQDAGSVEKKIAFLFELSFFTGR